ncbi:DUF2490 domain-containing protein [Seonamhaeicola sp.]|uniref:DUF2490 domain-containing protein n=1 Tax=Seonamhaeicola sp. TaxID=1912245 RepID=UPI0026231523|nr:DUF2490 domain-containing protein [Seonamhaeicola sp.]
MWDYIINFNHRNWKSVLATILCCLCIKIHSQEIYQFGLLPNISLSDELGEHWRLSSSIESRQILKEGAFHQPKNFGYQYLLTDVTTIFSKKVNNTSSYGGGYLLRLEDRRIMHRFIQQVLFKTTYRTFKLSHRFRTDQSFEHSDVPEFRFRYRLSMEFPLNGKVLNLKEFYFRLNSEGLNKFKSGYSLETRLVPLLGYTISKKQRFEFGLDYRMGSLLSRDQTNHKFWLKFNYYCKLEKRGN